MTKIVIEDSIINEIPVLSIYPEKIVKAPLVFYIHGYGADREQALDYGYMLAKKGFYYVSIDCKDHGKRKKANKNSNFSSVFPLDTGLDTYVHMHEIIEQAGIDIQNLIDYFKNQDKIDADRIGVSGFSMGGYASFYVAANNPDIKAAVSVAGKPAFEKAWEDSIASTATYDQWKIPLQDVKKEIKERTEFFRKIDPFEKLSNFSPKPLLIINGDQDMDSIFIYSLELYKKLLPLYSEHPDKLQLSMPFINHQFNYNTKRKASNWFEKYLS